MIKFLHAYRTKAVPPEDFADGEEVERSAESERYFVGLGVAGYLIDGKLYDQDHQPLVIHETTSPVVVDRRFADTGRGGEALGLDAPARATSGPGNVLTLSVDPEVAIDIDKLRSEFEDRMRTVVVEHDGLTGDIAQLRSQLAEVERQRDDAVARATAADTRAAEAQGKLAEATGRADAAAAELTSANARIAELEAASASKGDTSESGAAADPAATSTAAKRK